MKYRLLNIISETRKTYENLFIEYFSFPQLNCGHVRTVNYSEFSPGIAEEFGVLSSQLSTRSLVSLFSFRFVTHRNWFCSRSKGLTIHSADACMCMSWYVTLLVHSSQCAPPTDLHYLSSTKRYVSMLSSPSITTLFSATSSADGTLKLWALSDFTCIKSIDAHDASVLNVAFVTRGMQLVSSGADGLVKVRRERKGTREGSYSTNMCGLLVRSPLPSITLSSFPFYLSYVLF